MLPIGFHQDVLPAWRPGSIRITDSAFLPRTCLHWALYQCQGCRVFSQEWEETLEFCTLGIGEPHYDRF